MLFIRAYRLLFPDHSKEEQDSLANDLLEQSGVDYWKRAQDLTVEEFGAVCNTYQQHFMQRVPMEGRGVAAADDGVQL